MTHDSECDAADAISRLNFAIAPGLPAAWALLDSSVRSVLPPSGLLPNSLNAADRLAEFIQSKFRERPEILAPVTTGARMIALATGHSPGFTRVMISAAGARHDSVRLPTALLGQSAPWAIVHVHSATAAGPFVLDLVARYAHPRDRMKMLAVHEKADTAVEVNLAVTPSAAVIAAHTLDGYLLVFTTDPIAAELMALALAERYLAGSPSLAGPWEDRAVQRATELELGARIPDDIDVQVRIDESLRRDDVVVQVTSICERFGVAAQFL